MGCSGSSGVGVDKMRQEMDARRFEGYARPCTGRDTPGAPNMAAASHAKRASVEEHEPKPMTNAPCNASGVLGRPRTPLRKGTPAPSDMASGAASRSQRNPATSLMSAALAAGA
eukprot:CAMPEP_0117513538 /NCGR_PEP_ID=MMETSP0784-20121206/29605_1 /TAXON_ID=39447 /ORGANISM="" /LENGTH=113 /DNA_ID=CAMNT_0005309305 /DNA_START=85 /DNA_END=426 /DNA_ORIENTATION=+